MSTIEVILSRAMSDSAFADALFADPEKALAEYGLSPEVIAKFKGMSRADFEVLDPEERRSMSPLISAKKNPSETPSESVSFNYTKVVW